MADIKFFNVNQADYKHILASESNDGLMSAELYSKVKSLNDGKIPDIISDYARVEAKIDNVSTKLVRDYVTKDSSNNHKHTEYASLNHLHSISVDDKRAALNYTPQTIATIEGKSITMLLAQHTHYWKDITNAPSLDTLITTSNIGSYIDLSDYVTNDDLYYYATESYVDSNYVPVNSSNNHNHSNYATSSHSHSWSQITGKPSTFAPSDHTHSDSDLYVNVDSEDAIIGTALTTIATVNGTPIKARIGSYAPLNHNHDADYVSSGDLLEYMRDYATMNWVSNNYAADTHIHVLEDIRDIENIDSYIDLSDYVTINSSNKHKHTEYAGINHSHSEFLTSVSVTNNAATIGTAATTIAIIDGRSITAKIDSYAPLSHTHSNYAASSHTHSNYVAKSGDTMTGMLKINNDKRYIADSYSQLWVTSDTNVTLESTFSGTSGQMSGASWNNWGIALRATNSNIIVASGHQTLIQVDSAQIDLRSDICDIKNVPVRINDNNLILDNGNATYIYFNSSKTAYVCFTGDRFVFSHPVYHLDKILGLAVEDYVSIVITSAVTDSTLIRNNTTVSFTIFVSSEAPEALTLSSATVYAYNNTDSAAGSGSATLISGTTLGNKTIEPGESKSYTVTLTTLSGYYVQVVLNNNEKMVSAKEWLDKTAIPPLTSLDITYESRSVSYNKYTKAIIWNIIVASKSGTTINNIGISLYDANKNLLHSALKHVGMTLTAGEWYSFSDSFTSTTNADPAYATFTIADEKSDYVSVTTVS